MKNGLPILEKNDYPPMPDVKPPKSGSGVPNKSLEKREGLYVKAKLIQSLSKTLERNLRQGNSLRDRDIERVAKDKLIDVIKSLEV